MAETEQAASSPNDDARTPSLIASHVEVVYKVYGAKRVGTVSGVPEGNRLTRLLKGRAPSVGGVREVHAVRDVSFVAHHGESIGIIGHNGSGKSTLLRALAGLIPPTNGEVYLDGQAALLGVNAVLMRELSGERNIMIGGQALGLSPREVRERMDDIVEFAGVGEYIDLPMKAYSSGMAARLRFAISTAAVPDILMVDEALATGDAAFKARSQERIEEIREQAGTVFLVSHSDGTIRQICDRALWMDQGRLIMDGPSDVVTEAYREARQKAAPAKGAGKKPAPKKEAPAQEASAKEASAKGAPAKETPPKDAPKDGAATKPVAAKEAPKDEAATKPAPADQPPATAAPATAAGEAGGMQQDVPADGSRPAAETEQAADSAPTEEVARDPERRTG